MVRSRNFNNPNMGDPRCPEKKGFGEINDSSTILQQLSTDHSSLIKVYP